MSNTFRKEERLCSQKQIDRLYAEGNKLMVFPFSIRWLEVSQPENISSAASSTACRSIEQPEAENCEPRVEILIVAPKRKFHHAVDRNRVKRLTRECYRVRKESLYDFLRLNNKKIILSLVYIHHEILPFAQMEAKMNKILSSLEKDIAEKTTANG